MKNIIIIICLVFLVGCAPFGMVRLLQGKPEVKINIKGEESTLKEVLANLNAIYGKPTVEVSAFQLETGVFVVMQKLYYRISGITFVVVSIVNDKVLFIDTVHIQDCRNARG